MPFTSEQFCDVFGAYNNAIWPAQIVAYALGLLAAGFALWPSSAGDRIIAGVLALMWAWTGIIYHWLFFAVINPGAFLFGDRIPADRDATRSHLSDGTNFWGDALSDDDLYIRAYSIA